MAASKPYRVHPLAWDDIGAADAWYLERSPDAADAFVAEVSLAIETICEAPPRSPKYLHGTRRFLLHRFPFAIIYLDEPDIVNVIAVAHHKRRPDTGKGGFRLLAFRPFACSAIAVIPLPTRPDGPTRRCARRRLVSRRRRL